MHLATALLAAGLACLAHAAPPTFLNTSLSKRSIFDTTPLRNHALPPIQFNLDSSTGRHRVKWLPLIRNAGVQCLNCHGEAKANVSVTLLRDWLLRTKGWRIVLDGRLKMNLGVLFNAPQFRNQRLVHIEKNLVAPVTLDPITQGDVTITPTLQLDLIAKFDFEKPTHTYGIMSTVYEFDMPFQFTARSMPVPVGTKVYDFNDRFDGQRFIVHQIKNLADRDSIVMDLRIVPTWSFQVRLARLPEFELAAAMHGILDVYARKGENRPLQAMWGYMTAPGIDGPLRCISLPVLYRAPCEDCEFIHNSPMQRSKPYWNHPEWDDAPFPNPEDNFTRSNGRRRGTENHQSRQKPAGSSSSSNTHRSTTLASNADQDVALELLGLSRPGPGLLPEKNIMVQAYRKKAIAYHPDKNPNNEAWATEQMKRLNLARSTLGIDRP